MYGGQIVEQGRVDDLFYRPGHPYTWGLLGSLPRLDQETERLAQIPGQPPSLLRPPAGCRFAPRCPYVFDRCHTELPGLAPAPEEEHLLRCHLDAESRERHQGEVLGALAAGGAS
jgi:peptide/nickel transport system ATP-binding protein/oligopeptide transport system ATP-binding protein